MCLLFVLANGLIDLIPHYIIALITAGALIVVVLILGGRYMLFT